MVVKWLRGFTWIYHTSPVQWLMFHDVSWHNHNFHDVSWHLPTITIGIFETDLERKDTVHGPAKSCTAKRMLFHAYKSWNKNHRFQLVQDFATIHRMYAITVNY